MQVFLFTRCAKVLNHLTSFKFFNLNEPSRLALRSYTRGAEKLFHKVDWDRAVGLVVVVDPFDPGSLLYLPQAGYTDLIKTALANRSPLVVVHGLNDVAPTVSVEVDTSVKPNVEYRVFKVNGKEVSRIPISQNSPPLPHFSPVTSFADRKGRDRVRPVVLILRSEEPSSEHHVLKKDTLDVLPFASRPSRWHSPLSFLITWLGYLPDDRLGTYTSHLLSLNGLRSLNSQRITPRQSDTPSKEKVKVVVLEEEAKKEEDRQEPKKGQFPKRFNLPKKLEKFQKRFEELSYGLRPGKEHYDRNGSLHLDYKRSLDGLRSELGLHVYHTLRSITTRLIRAGLNTRPRHWISFLPKCLDESLASNGFPQDAMSPKRRPFQGMGRVEATLVHLYAWAGGTLLARSARSLQWTFQIVGHFIQIWNFNGLKTAVKQFSEAKRVLMKFLSGEPVVGASTGGVPLSIDRGLPKILPRALRLYIRGGHVIAIRLAFWCLSLADLFRYEAPPKLNVITEPYTGTELLTAELDEEIRLAVEDLIQEAGSRPPKPTWKGFHASIKAGPMAKAMFSAPLDAVALRSSDIWTSFVQLSEHIPGASGLVQSTVYMDWLVRKLMKPFWARLLGKLPVGKFSFVVSPKGKTRVVAIPGYQVQSLLKPLHDSMFSFLRKLECDHTFDQMAGVVRCMSSGNRNMHSFDLSAATDRFPRWFEEAVIRHLYKRVVQDSSSLAQAWEGVIGGIEFLYKKTKRGRVEYLKYGCGQPMGTYSSWSSFAISHHVIVKIAARRAAFPQFRDYELLGDDIVLRGDSDKHPLVFELYKTLMKGLGVGINPIKGVSSSNGSFEFAKRFVRSNDILTSLQWKELSSVTSWPGMFSLLVGMSKRGLPLPHLRVALEVGYTLISKRPFHTDLTNPRVVALWRFKCFVKPLVMLTSPSGPYKVPLIGWLSGQGTNLVDFHPNLGHFVNNITNVVFGNDIESVVANSMKSIRANLLNRILEAHGTAFGQIRALFKTSVMRFVKGSEAYATKLALFQSFDGNHITSRFRNIDIHSYVTLPDLLTAVGLGVRKDEGNPGFKSVLPAYDLLTTSQYTKDMLIGLLRTVINLSPAHIVNMRVMSDLAPKNSVHSTPDLDPDFQFIIGNEGRNPIARTPLGDRVGQKVQDIVPDRYLHPFVLYNQCKESMTAFMRITIADMLPSAMPSHFDFNRVETNLSAIGAWKSWMALRADPIYTTGRIFTFLERTDSTVAPAYLLEYTNSIRLGVEDSIPDPVTPQPVPYRLAGSTFHPLVYKPTEGFSFPVPDSLAKTQLESLMKDPEKLSSYIQNLGMGGIYRSGSDIHSTPGSRGEFC